MGNTPKRKASKKPRSRKQIARSPWPQRVAIAAGVVVAAAIVAIIALSSEPASGVPEGTENLAVGAPAHVEGELHEDGEVPAGGEHNPLWLNCGYYDTEVDSEFAVHSLEHGAVWITYNPEIGDDETDRLRGHVRRDRKLIVSPVVGLEDGILLTAWANQLSVPAADDARVEQFINEFAGSADAPEPGGSCSGGVGNPVF